MNDELSLQKKKRLARNSLQMARLSMGMKRTSALMGSRTAGGGLKTSMTRGPAVSVVAEGDEGEEGEVREAREVSPSIQTDIVTREVSPSVQVLDSEAMQMLADSYREVTGRDMPTTMTAEEAYAELRLLTIAGWQGEDAHLTTKSYASVGVQPQPPPMLHITSKPSMPRPLPRL